MKYKIKKLFPFDYDFNKLDSLIKEGQNILKKKVEKNDAPRILGSNDNKENIINEFVNIFDFGFNNSKLVFKEIVDNFFINIPRWRHPKLQYNVGAPVNSISSALYSLALDENIYNINDGLGGNSLLAEKAVSTILSDLANLKKTGVGFFTFGGTATTFYGIKIGISKACPESRKFGISKKVKIFITEDAHFAHTVSADWLGIGTENVIKINCNEDRSSDIFDAEKKMRKELEKGNIISTIILNGGTTYFHTIDDILSFVKLRDKLVKDYSLNYTPHIHVDSVIGWAWLVFNDYNFNKNKLNINNETLKNLEKQTRKISGIKYADSWGVDFHKGVGGCPVDCSVVMINDVRDINFISKKGNLKINTHQLASEFSLSSPSDFTLETSRSGGPPLAALASLCTLGKEGFQLILANLVELSVYTKNLISSYGDMSVCNINDSYGYVTMIRIYPPELKNDKRKFDELKVKDSDNSSFVEYINKYMKEFFSWDKKNRIDKGFGFEYSFSSGYMVLDNGNKVSGIKLYPVSPHFNKKNAREAVKQIAKQKEYFDKKVWNL